MKTNMVHQFSQVPKADIPRSTFNRSHGHKTTLEPGWLYPVLVDEALPGDTFNCNVSMLARLATPIFPIMDNMYLDIHFFSVPNRLVWDNWQKFNGEQRNPGDSTDFLVPQIVSTATTGYLNNSIFDYMGIPPKVPNLSHSALPLRAYNLIYNEWYRDENLNISLNVNTGDGPDLPTYSLQLRKKRHDYFTSCLPWPQKGPGVLIPLGDTAPVYTAATTGQNVTVNTELTPYNMNAGGAVLTLGSADGAGFPLYTDLAQATGATINSLRQAFQIQKIYERDARGGTRYTEIVKAHFGVTSPDARLQRPEYLGGGSINMNITPVPQTSASGTYAESPQGNLSGYGVAGGRQGFTSSFTEHCIIMGIVSVRADLTYQQGLHRMWSRKSRFDFYWPALSHIGEQAVLQKEIYASGVPAEDDTVFGYQERYAEYRYMPSRISGLFRSSAPQALDSWHLAQEFATPPVLDSTFIAEIPPIDRVIAVPAEPAVLFDSYFDMRCTRPMPVYGVPGLIDHF